jgi:uncharacterized protein
MLDEAIRNLSPLFDRYNGGFGGAPKFPPSMVIDFLLRSHARTGAPKTLEMAEFTLEKDGPGRHLRSDRRRLPSLYRRRNLADPAL